MERPTPRVTSDMLGECAGRTVRIVGKVIRVSDRAAQVDCNGQPFEMNLTVDNNLETMHFYEFVVSVKHDSSVQLLTCVDFGTSIDMDAYKNLVQFSNKYKSLFYE
ncbi:DNA replication factor A subunit Ssb3 [Schizosaccharomyces octosporus yFS286]|uniref:DNA replication factor A subunit Ssb3 n=1 Tax=Schizosaccharomyces octosporus (strain yFS286) TaxID=483514 RepID=S9QXF5_SCHOY|nr:DNA replication factor A subunit Ssb3 [Schizosaccharomyces octosporus yFS286]EPX70980.1 DNA replication factor A subunit Ssb3 [Schizosaccharomyces octosporus yFS286]